MTRALCDNCTPNQWWLTYGPWLGLLLFFGIIAGVYLFEIRPRQQAAERESKEFDRRQREEDREIQRKKEEFNRDRDQFNRLPGMNQPNR